MIEVVITGIVALLVGASGGAVLKTRQTSKDLKARLMIEAEDSAAEKLGLLYEENKAKELDIRLAEAQALATQADRDQAEAVRLAEENRANELRREILQKESIVAEARKLELEAERRKELEELEVRLEVELCKLKEMIDNSGLSITIEGGQPLWLSMDQACDLPAISAEANSRVMMDLLARLGLLVVSPSFLPPLRSDIERNDIRNTRRPVHIESELSKWGSGYDYGDDFPCYQTNQRNDPFQLW